MRKKTEETLRLLADMQEFTAFDDELTDIIRGVSEGELSEDELDMVTAASGARTGDIKKFTRKK